MVVSPGVEDIHQMLLDRILAGIYPPGSKLPSCRALATELGSNSSTVDRAIAQNLASTIHKLRRRQGDTAAIGQHVRRIPGPIPRR